MNEPFHDRLEDQATKTMWQNQPTEGVRMSTAEVQLQANKFQTKIWRRNAREYVAASVVVLFFAWRMIGAGDALVRTGMALIIAGTCYVCWQLHVRGGSRSVPEDAGLSSGIAFQRAQLVRQRDTLANVWRWYLGPLIPGLVLMVVAIGRANPGHSRFIWLFIGIYLGVVAAVFFAIGRLNKRGARQLQRQIDELDEMSR